MHSPGRKEAKEKEKKKEKKDKGEKKNKKKKEKNKAKRASVPVGLKDRSLSISKEKQVDFRCLSPFCACSAFVT